MTQTMPFTIGGDTITVNTPTQQSLLNAVAERFRAGRGFAIATLNLDHLVKLAAPEFRMTYAAQDFVTADGKPVVLMSRIAGRRVELVTGADLILPLAEVAAREQVRIGMLGSSAAALEAAKDSLEGQIEGLEVGLMIAPPMGFDAVGEEARAAIASFRAADVRLVFVALGAPKQEAFAAFARQIAPEIGLASIGAGLDFIAGTQQRAPVWVRRIGLEWLWRLLLNPRRLGLRYGRCLLAMPRLCVAALRLRLTDPAPTEPEQAEGRSFNLAQGQAKPAAVQSHVQERAVS